MKRHALQIVLLAFFVVNVAPSAASEGNGTETGADFTVTISREGVKEDMQQFFSLGPSATLRVVDESNSAILLPQAEGGEAQDSVAYEFENGHCNFGKTIAYKDMFSGYTEQVWARSSAEAGTEEKHGGKTSIYTFTNPPVEYLNGGVSFCVRFMTKPAVTTTTTTTTPTTTTAATAHSSAPTEGSSSDSTGGEGSSPTPGDSDATQPGTGGGGGSSSGDLEVPEQSPAPKPPLGAGPQDHQNGQEGPHEGGQGESEDAHHTAEQIISGQSEGGTGQSAESPQSPLSAGSTTDGGHSSSDLTQQSYGAQHDARSKSHTVTGGTASSDAEPPQNAQASGLQTSHGALAGAAGHHDPSTEDQPRLRRLSDTDASAVKYLTIVLHSAAASSSTNTLLVPVALLSITATRLFSV
ncbi:Toxoplasma gondii family A protein [Toxoplasma gondii ME49]|uniref:Toxoplasma gondii family A protein n=2 Tax=Toxoplasma gondii TaxID=5811 RepID=S8GPE3_TOXGM|nr:Toxoplasma gondii family A protein [Toxoplasma gondii ME49]EPT30439.1 Toxoplasma gondii family A protein [Toxoplasma gondii ME49]|eukprot:XP_002366812.1 Toxoplasma gondii family A protein [Toxoplasma gondii ME49]